MKHLVPCLLLGALVEASGCTLILPTDTLIKPCTASVDCDSGFECRENACLPIDEDESGDEGDADEGVSG